MNVRGPHPSPLSRKRERGLTIAEVCMSDHKRISRPALERGCAVLLVLLAALPQAFGATPTTAPTAPAVAAAAGKPNTPDTGGDPFGSFLWPELKREFLGTAPVQFDERVQVRGPAFAEDPMNVPITVAADGLKDVENIVVFVDRNPIRKVLEFFPLGSLPRVSFRFKLQQGSPVRAAVKTRDGVWHVGGVFVDSSGGGCTAPGLTRADGSWSKTLGDVSARVFPQSTPVDSISSDVVAASRVRLRVMHPMDTGLANGIPAFFINKLSLRDATGLERARLLTFEPVSENPIFSFDFADAPTGALTLVGTDNNGNRISGKVE
jgi:sulfur-oxidizing protein SoxY